MYIYVLKLLREIWRSFEESWFIATLSWRNVEGRNISLFKIEFVQFGKEERERVGAKVASTVAK